MKIVVITSGGMDSTVLLHYLAQEGHELRALAVDYGQRHKCELECAHDQAESLGIPFMVARLDSLAELLPGSSLTSGSVPVPEGHYTADNMKATVVPNRNMILLSVAMGHAIAHKFEAVAYAAHAGDHAIYPDCREEFAVAMNAVAQLCDWSPLKLVRPFIHRTKADIVDLGSKLHVDFSRTHSCYSGVPEVHCGRCGTCVERAEAFYLSAVPDPTNYADSEFALKLVAAKKFQD